MPLYYKDNHVSIYHADCADMLWNFSEREFDLLLTDPPYGIGVASQPTTGGRRRGQAREDGKEIRGQ